MSIDPSSMKSKRSYPTVIDILKVSKWLEKNRQVVVELRPTQVELRDLVKEETGISIGPVSLKSLCAELKISWSAKSSRLSGLKISNQEFLTVIDSIKLLSKRINCRTDALVPLERRLRDAENGVNGDSDS